MTAGCGHVGGGIRETSSEPKSKYRLCSIEKEKGKVDSQTRSPSMAWLCFPERHRPNQQHRHPSSRDTPTALHCHPPPSPTTPSSWQACPVLEHTLWVPTLLAPTTKDTGRSASRTSVHHLPLQCATRGSQPSLFHFSHHLHVGGEPHRCFFIPRVCNVYRERLVYDHVLQIGKALHSPVRCASPMGTWLCGCDPMKWHEAPLEACQNLGQHTRHLPGKTPLGRGFPSTCHSNVKYNKLNTYDMGKRINYHYIRNVIEKTDVLSRHHRFHNLPGLTPSSPVAFGSVWVRSDSVSRQNTAVPQVYQH